MAPAGCVLAGLTSTNKMTKLTGFAAAEASSTAAAEAATTDLIQAALALVVFPHLQ